MHLVEAVDTGGGFLRDPEDARSEGLEVQLPQRLPQGGLDDEGLLRIRRVVGGHGPSALGRDTLVDEQGGVTAVVEDQIGVRLARPVEDLAGAPPVLLERFTLPRENGHALGVLGGAVRADDDGGRRVILSGEDVAGRPPHLRAECHEGLDQNRGLDGHVDGSRDAGARQWLRGRVSFAHGHQAGHFVFGEGDLLAAETGQGQVCYTEVECHAPESTPKPTATPGRSWAGCRVPPLGAAFPGLPRSGTNPLSPAFPSQPWAGPRPIPR